MRPGIGRVLVPSRTTCEAVGTGTVKQWGGSKWGCSMLAFALSFQGYHSLMCPFKSS